MIRVYYSFAKDADLEALSLHPLFFITDYWLLMMYETNIPSNTNWWRQPQWLQKMSAVFAKCPQEWQNILNLPAFFEPEVATVLQVIEVISSKQIYISTSMAPSIFKVCPINCFIAPYGMPFPFRRSRFCFRTSFLFQNVVFMSECSFCFRILRFIFSMRFIFQNIAFLFQNVVCVSECRLLFGIAVTPTRHHS